jgi:hypothetical protein
VTNLGRRSSSPSPLSLFCSVNQPSTLLLEDSPAACLSRRRSRAVGRVHLLMFPESDSLRNIVAQTENVLFRRRLVDRVLRFWMEVARSGRFPSRDQIEPSMLGEDWANCCVIGVRSPVQLSYFIAIGENLSFTHCPNDSLAGVLLAHLPQLLLERRCLMIEGRAILRGSGILYRSALFPLSEDGVAIDYLLGAANHRPLRENEQLITPLVETKWL